MVSAIGKGHINVLFQILVGLLRQGKNKVHGNRFKRNGCQCSRHGRRIHGFSAKNMLILLLKGLDTDTDFGNTGILEDLQRTDSYIVGMKLQTDPLGNLKVLPAGIDDLLQPAGDQSGGASAKIQAGNPLLFRILAADHPDFLQKRIQITVAQSCIISYLAVWAKVANALAEWNVDI